MLLKDQKFDMSPKKKCEIAPRIFIKKGWGVKLRQTMPPFTQTERLKNHTSDDLVGEVFVYHKDHPGSDGIHSSFNPVFEVGTVKLLYVAKNKKLSLHFHKDKKETFFVVFGAFEVILISDGIKDVVKFEEGDTLYIPPCMIHQIKGLHKKNILLEVSTKDDAQDSYRIRKGD